MNEENKDASSKMLQLYGGNQENNNNNNTRGIKYDDYVTNCGSADSSTLGRPASGDMAAATESRDKDKIL